MKVLYDECIKALRDNKCSECNDFYQCSICDYFQQRYEQGKADMKKKIEESSAFYSNRPIEDIVLEARADAIEEYSDKLFKAIEMATINCKLDITIEDLRNIEIIIKGLAKQLKEQE